MNNLDFLRKSRKKKNIQIEMKNKILNKKNLIKTAYDIQTGDYVKFYNDNNNKYKNVLKNYIRIIKTEFKDARTIFDFGSGEMTTFYEVYKSLGKNVKYFANDLSLSRLYEGKKFISKKLKKNINQINFFTSPYFNMPLKNNSIDLVLTCHSLEPNNFCKEKILDELYRISKKGICMMEPHYEIADKNQKQRMKKFGYVRGIEKLFKKKKYKYKIFKNESYFNDANPSSIFVIKKKSSNKNSNNFVDPYTKKKLDKIENNYYNPQSKQVFLGFNGINIFDNEKKKILML